MVPGANRGQQGGSAQLESLEAAEGTPGQGRRLGEIVGTKQCTYDSECPEGHPCVFDREGFNLGLCFSRCGLCAV